MTAFKVVIPARFSSTRLPGKPLLQIAGKPMIEHVCERAKESGATEIVVATDDERIYDAVHAIDVDVVMTRPDHNSGTERIAEVADIKQWQTTDIIVNVQGDEPLLDGHYIREAAVKLDTQPLAEIATLAAPIQDVEEIFNPNAVKVVLNREGYALYFSRAAVPWDRERFQHKTDLDALNSNIYLRHIGLYAYSVGFLQRYCQWTRSVLESIESLEQLRILWHGEKIIVLVVSTLPEAGVDTKEDLQRVEKILRGYAAT